MKKITAPGGTPDNTNYKAILTNCCLYAKIATMSDPLFRDLSTRFQKEDIKYQYRKIIVKPLTIPPHSQLFISNNLFPDSETPLKIHFVLVKTTAYQGDYYENSLGFYRRWKVTKSLDSLNVSAEVENLYLRDQMLEMRAEMRRNMALLLEMSKQKQQHEQSNEHYEESDEPLASTSKGKTPLRGRGRAKNHHLRPYPPQRKDIAQAVEESDRESTSDNISSENSFVTARTNVKAASNVRLETEEIVYIKSFELELNSAPLDQVN